LEKVLHGKELDFYLMFSSLSSILGGLGFVAYSAANLFMDAFAHKYNQTKFIPWISVNWDGWQFREGKERNTAVGATLAELAILPKEGMRAFQRVLSMAPQVVVSTSDLQPRIDQWIKLESLRDTKHSPLGDPVALHARPNLHNIYVAPRSEVEQIVADAWAALLGIEQVGIHDNFFELGGHSLLAIQLISRLRDTFHVDLSVHSLFDAPTVAELAESIEKSGRAVQDDVEKIDRMLKLVEQFSEDEIRALLTEQEDTPKE
jgi:acyl carrier protein